MSGNSGNMAIISKLLNSEIMYWIHNKAHHAITKGESDNQLSPFSVDYNLYQNWS